MFVKSRESIIACNVLPVTAAAVYIVSTACKIVKPGYRRHSIRILVISLAVHSVHVHPGKLEHGHEQYASRVLIMTNNRQQS
eukprot:5417-Heterococcus_DN1.PRE.3